MAEVTDIKIVVLEERLSKLEDRIDRQESGMNDFFRREWPKMDLIIEKLSGLSKGLETLASQTASEVTRSADEFSRIRNELSELEIKFASLQTKLKLVSALIATGGVGAGVAGSLLKGLFGL